MGLLLSAPISVYHTVFDGLPFYLYPHKAGTESGRTGAEFKPGLLNLAAQYH